MFAAYCSLYVVRRVVLVVLFGLCCVSCVFVVCQSLFVVCCVLFTIVVDLCVACHVACLLYVIC